MEEQDILAGLGANVKYFRKRSGWSQLDLVEKINISIPFLSNMEQGKTLVSPGTLLKLLNIFNLELYELFKQAGRLAHGYTRLLDKYNADLQGLLNDFHRKYLGRFSKQRQ